MKQFLFITITSCILLFYACGSGEQNSTTSVNQNDAVNVPGTENNQANGQTNNIAEEADVQPQENDKVLAWVDNLNIREQANIKSKVVAQAKENEPLTLTGKKTNFTETIELRGTSYTEPWIEVKTADGKTGWVFQGAVKRPDEEKGSALNTANKFTYPHFGTFDLTTWKKVETKDDSDSDELDRTVDVYTKGGQTLEIGTSSMGEFYWSRDYKLMDVNKKVIKERELKFTIDPLALTETVKDCSSAPPKQYTRTQNQKQHWYQMNAKPDMASGEWKVSTLADNATNTKNGTAKSRLGTFGFGDCTKHVSKEFDCSCSFSTGDPHKGPIIFLSNWGESACVKVDDELNALYPDWEGRDYKAELKKLAQSKDWITVKNSGVLYFGKPLKEYKYKDAVEFLTDVILASGKDMKTIPIQNTAEGMAIREIRDQADEAIAKAKVYRSKGGDDPLYIVKMDNRKYDVFVRYRQITQYEGEANQFDGKIILLQNRGKEILESKAIKGTCGC